MKVLDQPPVIETGGVRFVCEDPYEVARAQTLETKEPGTMAWLRATLRPGDVFYDIGANIGCYSLVAARLVGETGHVYAFEPHLFNAASLLRNIQANGLTERITVVTTPLAHWSLSLPFHYASLRAGSSGHQLGRLVGESGATFQPTVSVLAQSARLDDVDGVRPADIMKIDVDGLELPILLGMATPRRWPRSVQVEMHPGDRAAITALMLERGFEFASRHYTHNGQKAVNAGADPATVTDNAIFIRGAA